MESFLVESLRVSLEAVWAGISEEKGELLKLQAWVQTACEPFMASQEKGQFVSHVTLARVRHLDASSRQQLVDSIRQNSDFTFGSWKLREVLLMQSELGGSAARYTIVRRFPLAFVSEPTELRD